MGRAKEYSKNIRQGVVDLHKSGSSLGDIAGQLKMPKPSVQTIVNKYKDLGTTLTKPRSGRKRKLAPKMNRHWCER